LFSVHSIGQLKYNYLQIARQKFKGKVFINKDTGNPIRVSRDGIMEWWRKSRRREHIISVQLLDFFLRTEPLSEKIPNYRGQDIHNFFIENASPICIPENIYNAPVLKDHT
jgi:hypothetical protein